MNAQLSKIAEPWRRAPSALLRRAFSSASAPGPAPKVALYAQLPEAAGLAGARFELGETAGVEGGSGEPAGIAELRRNTPALAGTLTFPAGYACGEYVSVVASAMRPLTGAGVPARTVSAASGALPNAAAGPAAASSLNVVVGRGAKASVFLRVSGDEGIEALLLWNMKILVEDDGELSVFVLSDGGEGLEKAELSEAFLGARAKLVWTEADFSAGPSRSETVFSLDGANASLDINGAYGARGRSERERSILERHNAPGGKSRAVLKSVLRDQARLVFRGLIEVSPAAPGTDAYLSNRNLLLDDGARAESLPQLKIDQDDVACSHGSTTGGPRDDELFYLMSRGLALDDARTLLAVGHLGSVFGAVPADLLPRLEAAAQRAVED